MGNREKEHTFTYTSVLWCAFLQSCLLKLNFPFSFSLNMYFLLISHFSSSSLSPSHSFHLPFICQLIITLASFSQLIKLTHLKLDKAFPGLENFLSTQSLQPHWTISITTKQKLDYALHILPC